MKEGSGYYQIGIGERVRYFRKQKGMTQSQLAEDICSESAISQLEHGKINVNVHLLTKIAERLGVPLHEIHRPAEDDEFPNDVSLDLIEVYISRNELDIAQELLTRLQGREDLVEVEKHKWHYLQAKVWNTLKEFVRTIELLVPFLEQLEARQLADDVMMCQLYNQLGSAYYHSHRYAKSLSAFERGYSYVLRIPVFETPSANLTYNLAKVCNELELRTDAAYYLEKARTFFESVSDLKGLAHTYFQSAIATKDPSYLYKAKQVYEELELRDMINLVRQHEAFHVKSKVDYKKAVDALHSIALEFYELNKLELCIYTLTRAVTICLRNNDLFAAQVYVSLASKYKEELPNDNGQYTPDYYYTMAKFYYANKIFPECLKHAYKASDLYDNMDLGKYSSDALAIVVDVLRDMQQFEEALNVASIAREKARYRGGKKE